MVASARESLIRNRVSLNMVHQMAKQLNEGQKGVVIEIVYS